MVELPVVFVVDDARSAGIPSGWQVVASVTSLVGPDAATIPASAVSGHVSSVATIAGSPSSPDATARTTLHEPRPVLIAPMGQGDGRYEATLNVRITVPAYSRPGAYAGNLSISVVSAP